MTSDAASDPRPGLAVPVVFIVFNRPDCAEESLRRIRAARPQRLYVIADGPRSDRAAEASAVAETRAVIDRLVDWPCEVRRNYSDVNLGCASRISSGLTWVFEQETAAIILEDDCVADPTFFPYCAELLDRYRDCEQVAQIAGCSFQDHAGPTSYHWSRYPHCWGWATWRRAWRHYDATMRGWEGDHGWLRSRVENDVEFRLWAGAFDRTAAGQVDSWAYRWTVTVFRQGWVTALPYQNLVSNVGFGRAATHTRRSNPAAARPLTALSFPLVHPSDLRRDAEADTHTSRLLFQPASLPVRVWRKLTRPFFR